MASDSKAAALLHDGARSSTGAQALRAGVTTDEIDRVIHGATVERNGYPRRSTTTTSQKRVHVAQRVICHGIPDSREVQENAS